jgi:uncharacterized membrane protein (UPF0127 family)
MKSLRSSFRYAHSIPGLLLAGLLVVAAGCTPKPAGPSAPGSATNNAPAPAPAANQARTIFDRDVPTVPNPKLPTLRLFVGAQELKTELALNELQIRTGMMFRTGIAEDEAMLFVFPVPHQVGFWMKNVSIELSCAYIDPEGVILEIHDMVPHEVRPIESTSDRVQYVLETSRGWFQRHGIQPGTLIRTERGTLRETFFQRPAR